MERPYNINQFHKGMLVKIIDIKATHARHSSNGTMRRMIGHEFRIQKVGRTLLKIEDFTWYPGDVKIVETIKNPKPSSKCKSFLFDEKLL